MAVIEHFIENFSESFIWRNRGLILKATFVLPIALELICLLGKSVYYRSRVGKSLRRHVALLSCRPIGKETLDEAKKRQRRQIIKLTAIALTVIAVSAASFYLAPALIATSVAIAAISIGIKTYKDPKWINRAALKFKQTLLQAYVPKKGESKTHATLRIAKNLFLTSMALTALGFGFVAFHYLIIGKLFVHSAGNWIGLNPAFMNLINQPFFVFGAHFTMGIFFGQETYKGYKKKGFSGYASAIINCINMGFATIAPFVFLLTNSLQLQSMSYSLALLSMPFNCTQIFAMFMNFDGFLSMINPHRGYYTRSSSGVMQFHQYDYNRLVATHALAIAGSLFIGAALEILNKVFFASMDQKRKEQKQEEVKLLQRSKEVKKIEMTGLNSRPLEERKMEKVAV